MRKKSGTLTVSAIVLCITLLASTFSFPGMVQAQTPPSVTVTVNAPTMVLQDSLFTATLDISAVTNLDACNYDVSFNPSVLEVRDVTAGNINGVAIPVDGWNLVPPGTVRVVQNVPGVTGVSGSGYLARVNFHVIGSSSQTSPINLANGQLGNNQGAPIAAQWLGDSVQVTYHRTAQLIITAPTEVAERGSFNASVNINEVQNFDAANYEVSYNPAVLELTGVTAGKINGVDIPVTGLNQTSGKVSIVQNVPGVQGVSGTGTLSVIQFRVLGLEGTTSNIAPANGALSDNQAQIIPSQWTGTSVRIISATGPMLATNPDPPSHDFGSVPEGEIRTWPFEITNIGKGTLEWTASSNQPWLTLNPATGTTTTEVDSITATVNTAGLAGGATYTATIAISSTGGSKTGTVTVAVPLLPSDLTVTDLTWLPADISDGNIVTFTATVKNIGQGKTGKDFYVRFDLDGTSVGHRLIAGGLAAGASIPVTQTWVATPGTHNVKAIADENNTVTESNETNNELAKAMPVVVSPDLIITSLTSLPATSANDGDVVTITATVKNNGAGNTVREFYVRFEVDNTYLGHQKVSGLTAGSTAAVSQTWTARPGSHTAKAVADEYGVVAEADETNNVLTLPLPQVNAPDLTITGISHVPDVNITDGVSVTLTASVKNIGTGNIAQGFFVRFEVDGNFIGRQFIGNLAAGGTVDVSQTWLASPGNHTAKAIADEYSAIIEADETNNALERTLPAVAAPDFVVSNIVWLPDTGINDGTSLTFTATVQNNGTGSTAREFFVRFEIDNVAIGSQRIAGLAAGASVDVSQPWVAKSGNHAVKAIADESNLVAESNEGNNLLTRNLPAILAADLTVTGVTFSPANINDGDNVNLTATVKNIGAGNTAQEFYVRFEIDGNYVGHQKVSGLAADASVDVVQVWVARSGGHTAKAIADEANVVAETSETNNEFSLVLPGVAAPDLTVTGIAWTPTGNINEGSELTIKATVKNVGQGHTTREFFVRFEVDGQYIGRQNVNGLQAGASVEVSQAWLAQSGNHTAKVIADEYNVVNESDETNNQLTQPLPQVLSADITVSTLVFTPVANINDGDVVTFTATVRNIGQGNTAKEFYIRFDVGGTAVGRQRVTGLAAGASIQVNQTWQARAGDHTVKAIADEYNNIIESDETNNEFSQALPRILSPDLVITGITFLPASNINDGNTVTLTAAVKNNGEGNTTREFFVRFAIGGTAIGSQKVSGLPAGNSVAVNQTWIARAGTHTASAIADETGVVAETSEANNEMFLVLPAIPFPDMVVTNLTWSPQALLHGKIATFSAVVENRGGATSRDFMVRFEVDGAIIGRQKVSGLASSATVTQPWIAVSGALKVKAVADEDNVVAETDEQNNSLQVDLPTIPTPPQVRLLVPNGGEIWFGMQTITWEASSPDANLAIAIDLFDGSMFRPVAITGNTGSYQWDTRRLYDGSKTRDGTTNKIRLTATDSLGVSSSDESNTWFTLFNTPLVTITAAPNQQRTIENVRAAYTLSIFNQQPAPDAFNLVVMNGNNAAVAQLSQDSISISAWGRVSLTLEVTDETPGSYAVGVTAVSQSNSQVTSGVTVVTEVIPAYTIALSAPETTTSIGGSLSYVIRLQNNQSVPDTFSFEITGIGTAWFVPVAPQPMGAGEAKDIPLRVIVPDSGAAGAYTIVAKATSARLTTSRQASAPLNVVAEPIISGLSPQNGSYSGSTEVLVAWKTSVTSSSTVGYRVEGTATYTELTGDAGISHAVLVAGLTRNNWYEFYAKSQNTNGTTQSEVRRVFIDNGITFTQRAYNFTIQRNYDQRVNLGVRNTDDEPHQLSLSIESVPRDLPVGFVGAGSVDLPITLQAGESRDVILAFHAQDALSRDYALTLKLTASSVQPIVDYAQVNLHINVPVINFSLTETATDPVNLTKTIRLTNSGDPITDFKVVGDANLAGRVLFRPAVEHAYLGTGQVLDFMASPILFPEFAGLQGNIVATGGGQSVLLPVNFALPAGKRVYIGSAAATLNNQPDRSRFPTWEVTVVEFTENRTHIRAYSPLLNDTAEWIIETTRGVSYTPTQEELDMGLGVYAPKISWSEAGGKIQTVFESIVTSRSSELVRTRTRTLVGAFDKIKTTVETGKEIYDRVETIHEQVQEFRNTQSLYDEAMRQGAIDRNAYEALTITNTAERIYNCGVGDIVSNIPGVGPMIDNTIKMGFGTLDAGARIFTRHAMELNAVMDELFGVNGVYCINGVQVQPGFGMPSTIQPQNIVYAGLGANLYQATSEVVNPHDIHFWVNGQEAGALMNTLPEGYYHFGFSPSWLNFTGFGVAHNDIWVTTRWLNPGHFWVATGFTIYTMLRDVNIAMVAGSQQEANEMVGGISNNKVIMPDFSVYPEKIKFYPSNPRIGQASTINITVYNEGTLGGDAILRVYDTVNRNNNPIFTQRVIIPRFGNRVVSVPWQPAGGNHTIWVTVNTPPVLREKSNQNNQATRNVDVLGGDTTLPSITNPLPLPNSTTTNNKPVISADLSDDSGINTASVTITVDGTNVTTSATVTPTRVTYTPAQALPDGVHNVSVSAQDIFQNSKTLSWSFTVDTSDVTQPAITNPQPVPGSTIKNNPPAISADLSDASGINVASVKIKVDNVDVTGSAAVTATSVTYTPAQALPDGLRNISVYAEDTKGNSRTLDWSFTIDSTPPQITSIQVQYLTGTTATITWNTNEPSDSLLRFGTVSGNYPWQKGSTDMVTAHSVPLAGLTPETTYYYVVKSADALNNPRESAESTFRTATDVAVTFPDANLEAAIRQAIAKPAGVIYKSELAALITFNAINRGIVNLTGLENCTGLNILELSQNQISDISPLASLTALNGLTLNYNQVSDISPLASLNNLTYLHIQNNQISNIATLASLTNLITLSLNHNQISNVSPLAPLTNLTGLEFEYNQINNISPLASLTKLINLSLVGNQITDISPLTSLSNISFLFLSYNQINDISPLASLSNLVNVDLNNNQISNVSPLTSLTNLHYIRLHNNLISDISTLVANSGIAADDEVNLKGNPLNASSLTTYIPQLQARGVNVLFDMLAGDATGDGIVDAADITKVERIIALLDPANAGADANRDGRWDALDITKVEIIIAGP